MFTPSPWYALATSTPVEGLGAPIPDFDSRTPTLIQGVAIVKLGQFAKEVTRISQEVGTEGELGGQAHVLDVEGTWSIGVSLAVDMRHPRRQVRSIAKVTQAVALGDLSKQIEVDTRSKIPGLKNTVTGMAADQLRAFASEVTRVTLKVETGSKAGDSWGTRRSRVDSFIRALALGGCEQATKAVAAGDLTKFMNVKVLEEMLDLMMTVNPMVVQLITLANKVTGVSFEVGTEAILGGQAVVPECRASPTDNLNLMAVNMANRVRSIAQVTKAIAKGALTKKIDVDEDGRLLLLLFMNGMESLSVFAGGVMQVARAVGTGRQLGGQARVTNVNGTKLIT
ncbi:putative two-component sensor histidine kinase/response regulator hybrid protein [Ephemerocybe angulata]|uniref:Putative two-component sensor histidine kinase/response regulator hybrid protein n=1 Tax=Ephemerocybe angulata TaxID=980116 RepID=A0A8H6HAS2_9AGAR|nr:putative two-component sensor histidine kinase/response regulator hybrid protein [Tulosesus angulatus]